MKILFICSTELQLFNALNLKMHLFRDDTADIIIQFLKKDTVDFYHRVKDTGLFENVCYRLPDVFGLHQYARCIRKGDFSKSFLEAAKNTAKQIYVRIVSQKNKQFIDNVKGQIFNFDRLELGKYQQIFAGGTNVIVVNILKYVRTHNPACKLNLYEEGVGSYVFSTLGCDSDIHMDYMYLYEPKLAVYTHPCFVSMPKVRRTDTKFLSVINKVFDYQPEEKELKNKIIFFDNPSNPLPSYLTIHKLLSKTLFYVPYKKHLHEHETYLKQQKLFKLLKQYSNGKEIIVKLHPRTERDQVVRDYNGANIRIMGNISVPWEVFCCNCDIRDNVFVTYESSAITSNAFTVADEDNNISIICRYAVNEGIFDKYRIFHETLSRSTVKHQFFLPQSEDQYIEILRELFCG